ncbi:MAG: hypothetical protein JWO81_1861 [Alphaproteobacteria bacterium]|nr:hypothetical protein [Alphaproteobacteria bacterium]
MSDPAAPPAPPPAPAPPPDAPRLRRIEVTDFRAFPKGHPGILDLGEHGCSLLVFGENGAGKSSLYRALRDLFSASPPPIADLHNVFSDLPAPSVRVTLTDNAQLTWSGVGHPTADVTDIARRSAFLTHTALRELVYNPGKPNEPLDLFETMISNLIDDFDATLEGGVRRSVGELWTDVQTALAARVTTASGTRRPQNYIRVMETACTRFNEGMRQALDRLEPKARELLRRLLDVLQADPMDLVGIIFTPVTYSEAIREIEREPLTASVRVRTHLPRAPQSFLNEARQTALAIAVYLAARLICVPPGRDRLKLLVMDDLLISLDATHRRPVLDLILELFADWQIILLTHDRYWFELAREQLKARTDWKAIEIYERYQDDLMTPYVRDVAIDMAEATLVQAEAFLDDNHPAAACNYARSACEIILERFCIRHGLKFKFPIGSDKRPALNELLNAAKNEVKADAPKLATLRGLEPHKRFVLNPFSHNPVASVPAADVRAAIVAVRKVALACST